MTMTNSRLIARLEQLTAPDREVDAEIAVATKWQPLGIKHWVDDHPDGMSPSKGYRGWVDLNNPPVPDTRWQSPEYTASVDAALALAAKVFPTWKKSMFEDYNGKWIARISSPRRELFSTDYMREHETGGSPNPAIALCIAILKAHGASNG